MCQLFGSGARFSDLLFLKFKHFQKDGIQIETPKTGVTIKFHIPLCFYELYISLFIEATLLQKTEFENLAKFNITSNTNAHGVILDFLRKDILNYVSNHQKEDFFFSFVPIELKNFDPSWSFVGDEFKIFARCRNKYNRGLAKIALDWQKVGYPLSSHAFRYKFVSNCLEQKVSIYEISKCLNHSSIAITENYIKKNFTIYDNTEVSNLVDQKYLS